jgi:hypothetical protein
MLQLQETPPATSWEWRIEGVNVDSYFRTPTWGSFCAIEIGSNPFTLYVRAINDCGYTETSVTVYPGGSCHSALVYPNPVNDVLHIDINLNTVNSRQALTYEFRLYDSQGTMQRAQNTRSSTAQIDVSSLPDGIYFLHIYDGVNSTPEVHRIIVKH